MAIGTISTAMGVLFVFGFLYDQVVGWLEGRGYDEGYTALLVAFGVLVTLAGGGLIDWALLVWLQGLLLPWAMAVVMFLGSLAAFAASGFWMVVGSAVRHARRRRAGQESYLSGGAL